MLYTCMSHARSGEGSALECIHCTPWTIGMKSRVEGNHKFLPVTSCSEAEHIKFYDLIPSRIF